MRSNIMMNRELNSEEWQEQADAYLREALDFEKELSGLTCCEPLVQLRLVDACICETHARISRELERKEWLGAQTGVAQYGDSWCRQ